LDKTKKPIMIIIAGPNGSGKTSITWKLLNHEWLENATYINPDNVANDLFGDWNSQEAIKKAADYCDELREKCLATNQNIIFETVLSSNSKVDFILKAMKKGYFIRLFFVCTNSPTINASRIAKRVLEGGHDVPIPKIISRYSKSILNSYIVRTIKNLKFCLEQKMGKFLNNTEKYQTGLYQLYIN
jgi:predicted ABC-type ATPase